MDGWMGEWMGEWMVGCVGVMRRKLGKRHAHAHGKLTGARTFDF